MQNALPSKARANQNGYARTSGNLAQPPTTHGATQPPSPPLPEGRRTPHQVDADLIESILTDTKVRIDLLLDDSDSPVLPLSSKVFREAVACGLLRLVRDPAGRVVRVENAHARQELSIEDIDAMFGLSPAAQAQDQTTIGSSYNPVIDGNPASCGDSDVDVNWAALFSNRNDRLNLAERGETMQPTWAALDEGRADGDVHMLIQGPGPSRRYGGGSAAAQF